ncbi:hypothetical protein NLG97_g649 [Lecanicillium saksenae]|uniref:Uncharacterized protein n=1 Tax=Lecanicillium saksenae TaxID=468837 RepID=A0ACC1R9G3_9HYPO|nr:hypothetical protein NLG97_g649 [Lecanicillium saksenae]
MASKAEKDGHDLGDVTVNRYADSKSSALPEAIPGYHRRFVPADPYGMLTTNFQSKFHLLIASAISAKREIRALTKRQSAATERTVLEIGVFKGYSAFVFSHAVGPDGLVTGLEISADYAKQATDALTENGATNVEIIVGPASETLRELAPATPYDLAFIDADKEGYRGYLDYLLEGSPPGGASRLLRPGALILLDNILWRGQVAQEGAAELPRDEYDRAVVGALRSLNDHIVREPRLQSFVLPLFDGLTILRLLD